MILNILFLFIGTTEILFILFMVVMIFGADKLPDIAKGMGKGMRMMRDASNDIKNEVTKTVDRHQTGASEATKNFTEEVNKVKEEVEELTGSVKRKM